MRVFYNCVSLYTATFRMIRHMLACFSFALTISLLHAYIYLPILPSTCTSNMYINANHKLVYHYLTYSAILQSATWTVYGLQYCTFLSTHLKPATRGRIRFKIIWFFLFGLCLRHTLILWVSVNYRGHLLTSTVVLQAIFSENDWPFDSMPERWRYVAWRVRVYDLGHISKKSPAKRHSAWPKFIKSFWNCFLNTDKRRAKYWKKKKKITHTHIHTRMQNRTCQFD